MQSSVFLKKTEDFNKVYDKGKYLPGRLLAIKVLKVNGEATRFGIVASKKVGGAVERNRVRRKVREIVRTVKVEQGWDIVLIIHHRAVCAVYEELSNEIRLLLKRAGLLVVGNEDNCISAD